MLQSMSSSQGSIPTRRFTAVEYRRTFPTRCRNFGSVTVSTVSHSPGRDYTSSRCWSMRVGWHNDGFESINGRHRMSNLPPDHPESELSVHLDIQDDPF